jgi:hypothetical protein
MPTPVQIVGTPRWDFSSIQLSEVSLFASGNPQRRPTEPAPIQLNGPQPVGVVEERLASCA